MVAADVGRLLVAPPVRVLDVVVREVSPPAVLVVKDVVVVEVVGLEVRVVAVGRELSELEVVRVAEVVDVVRLAEEVAVRDEIGARVVVVRVVDVEVAEVDRDEGVVRADSGVRVEGVVLVAGVVLVEVVAVERTAPPGVVRAEGRGVPGLTFVGVLEGAVEGRDRDAAVVVAAVVLRGAGLTGAFFVDDFS